VVQIAKKIDSKRERLRMRMWKINSVREKRGTNIQTNKQIG
jgi:hypothetical protein